VAKAESTQGEADPRFIVTWLTRAECNVRYLYEKVYCDRGDMENRIKECQLHLYPDRTSTTIRLKLPRIGALVIISVHRIRDRFVAPAARYAVRRSTPWAIRPGRRVDECASITDSYRRAGILCVPGCQR
jgi:Transposase DDE domain group 1